MDRLNALGTQLSQITMYDVKSMYNQVRLYSLLWLVSSTHEVFFGIVFWLLVMRLFGIGDVGLGLRPHRPKTW